MPEGGVKTSIDPQAVSDVSRAQDDKTFGPTGLFSPGTPLEPVQSMPPRRIDFPTGYNLQYHPRAYEPFSFAQLRSFANVELVRLAIETRKDQTERLEWMVRPRKNRKKRVDVDERIRSAERLIRRPDGVTHFDTWMRPLMEDMLAIDAATVERRRNRGGSLIGLDVVDGATIRLLVDSTGRTPRPPEPAYQQIIKSNIWADLTTEDIAYLPRNPRSNHMYGFSPVEQVVVTLNTALRRQTSQLAYFTEGNVPQGIINAPEGWTPDQIKTFQEWIDSRLSGQAAERAKLLWVPKDSKYQAFKEPPLKDEFDEWLARIVSFAFSLPPTPFIRQMNRGTAQEDQDRALEEGLMPLLLWAKRFWDSVIQEDLGFYDLEFVWDTSEDLDPKKQSEIHDIYLRNGTLSVNEVRDDLGLDPTAGGEKPLIYTPTGAVPLDGIQDQADLAMQTGKKTLSTIGQDPAKADEKDDDDSSGNDGSN